MQDYMPRINFTGSGHAAPGAVVNYCIGLCLTYELTQNTCSRQRNNYNFPIISTSIKLPFLAHKLSSICAFLQPQERARARTHVRTMTHESPSRARWLIQPHWPIRSVAYLARPAGHARTRLRPARCENRLFASHITGETNFSWQLLKIWSKIHMRVEVCYHWKLTFFSYCESLLGWIDWAENTRHFTGNCK